MTRQTLISRLIRSSVLVGSVGLICLLIYLIAGFDAWTVGIGIFLGFPLMILALILYLVAVIKDLKRHNVVRKE